jgi:hypothetical protein
MRRNFYYFPLDQLAPEGGELALAEAAAPTPDLFAEGATQRLESVGIRTDDLLALTDGREVLAIAHLTALPATGAPSWRRLPLTRKVDPFPSAPNVALVAEQHYPRFNFAPEGLLAWSSEAPSPRAATPPPSPTVPIIPVLPDIAFLPFTPDTRTENILLHGPPGTGKTWALKERALRLILDPSASPPEGTEQRKRLDEIWSRAQRREQVAMCTFHQAYTYEEFVEGIRPRTDDKGKISYSVEDGLFKKLALLALAEGLGDEVRRLGVEERVRRAKVRLASDGESLGREDFDGARQFVLVIDEINRANVARVMGELITLLEDDKRLGGKDPLVLRLPASRERFAVPPNLHVIGTLNTADRSIALMDVALRRRFAFEEKRPDKDVLQKALPEGKALSKLVVDIFTTINDRLLFLYDREHQIGHAYFLKIRSIEDLRDVMVKKVLPLLQEYFFGQWQRVALVLGHKMEDAGRTPALTGTESSVLLVKKIEEKQTLGFDHEDYADQHTIEVHPGFKSRASARDWLVKALVSIVEADPNKRPQRVAGILAEAPQASAGVDP